jgi:hypothetical protein
MNARGGNFVQRKALILSLGLALLFAALPAMAVFAVARPDGGEEATVRITLDGGEGLAVEPVAFGLDAEGDCPEKDSAGQSF